MRSNVLVCVSVLLALCTGLSRAQEPTEVQAPAEVLATMPAKAVSILYGKYPLGPNHQEVLVHVFAIPKAEKAKGSGEAYKREDFMGLDVPKSTFTVDLFRQKGGRLERLNRVRFQHYDGVNGILIKWLEPRVRRGPVVCLHLGTTHWLGWELIAFPDGLRGHAALQRFEYGGEGNSGIEMRLDGVDRHGRMAVSLDSNWGDVDWEEHYLWSGRKFVERLRPYFVITASVKSHKAAQAFCRRHGEIGSNDIQPSSSYPKLTPGYFIVVAERFETQQAAENYARKLSLDQGIACYQKRAF